ncbi:MAG: dihydroneopterin aldolase [Bacteroidota bacterium]
MGQVSVNNIKVYAYHGCLREESIIGSDYRVDVTINTDLTKASFSDNLTDTVDYVHINSIVKEEMKVPSKLLEHVARRMLNRIFDEIPSVSEIEVSVSKINPPIGGNAESVTIVLHEKRR